MKRTITQEAEKFICDNALKYSSVELGRKFGVPKGTIISCWRRNGVVIPKEIVQQRKRETRAKMHKLYRKGDSTIKANYLTMPEKTLAAKIGRSNCYVRRRLSELGLVIPNDIIEQRKQIGRIKKGAVPPNKGRKQTEYMTAEAIEKSKETWFKKGSSSVRWKDYEDGDISVRRDTKSGVYYYYVREHAGKWVLYHRVLWEAFNGPIPKGYLVAFKDGNQMNVAPENLELKTMADNMLRNSAQVRLTDGYVINAIAGGKYRSDPEFKEEMKKHSDLIEIKRLQLLLNRALKNKESEQKQ